MSYHGYEGVMSVLCTPLQVKCYRCFFPGEQDKDTDYKIDFFFAVSADYIYFCTSAAQSQIPKTASKYDKNRKQNTHRLSAETQSDKELMETITILYSMSSLSNVRRMRII